MDTSIEINNKEKQLVELMHRVLKEPISPLKESINQSQEYINKIFKKCDSIEDTTLENDERIQENLKILKKLNSEVSKNNEALNHDLELHFSKVHSSLESIETNTKETIAQLKIDNNTSLALIHSRITELEGVTSSVKAEITLSAENTFTKTNDVLQNTILNATKQVNDLQDVNLNELLNALIEQNQGLQASIKQSQEQFTNFKKLSFGFFAITLAFIAYEIAAKFIVI